MPGMPILLQTTIELSVYGLIAGLLSEKYNLRVIWSLLCAMAAGRLALLLAVAVRYLATGETIGPLGPESNPAAVLQTMVTQGWPGIIIQIISIPLIILLANMYLTSKSDRQYD